MILTIDDIKLLQQINKMYSDLSIADSEQLEEITLKAIKDCWYDLGEVAMTTDGTILEEFLHFDIGTDKQEIWNWFEDTFDINVIEDLIYG